MTDSTDSYDIFLSHGAPDKDWVRTLADALAGLGLRVYLDERQLKPGDNWVIELSKGLASSRYMALVLSNTSADRSWVLTEWTAYVAEHGPLGRLVPVLIDPVKLPTILASTQRLDATDRDASRVAEELFKVVGDPSTLSVNDARGLYLGRDWVFTLSRVHGEEGDGAYEHSDDSRDTQDRMTMLRCVRPNGTQRYVPLPWTIDRRFGIALMGFQKLTRESMTEGSRRTELQTCAKTLGESLLGMLFDEDGEQRLAKALRPRQPRPVVTIRSDDDLLLSLPWELLHWNGMFLVRDQRVDVVRTTLGTDHSGNLLGAPTDPFRLVLNVSAPEGSGLHYEAESYRITLALAGRCEMAPTELGTLDDFVETVKREGPHGVHFSGHGSPGALHFEDPEGRDDKVLVGELVDEFRRRLPEKQRQPSFFYLASCHGATPSEPEKGESGSSSSATLLHREGFAEVVGYFGPIVDELSTRAEEALYDAIAEGQTTRYAVRQARAALAGASLGVRAGHRPRNPTTSEAGVRAMTSVTHPFAWSQLVLYRRGPEHPLSVAAPIGVRVASRKLCRRFDGVGPRRTLRTGFIGRRVELHKVRRKIREGERVLVFQGLGGLGKSTLAARVLPMLTEHSSLVCILWCEEAEAEADRAEALVKQLLVFCRDRFGSDWEAVVQQVDRGAQNSVQRFLYFLSALIQKVPQLVLYLDNLESLLIGPGDEDDGAAFGQWASPDLERLWEATAQLAEGSGKLYLVASVRYRNASYDDVSIPVSPLPRDALFRLTEWFPSLRKLTVVGRARLAEKLEGHPRGVEYANDLVKHTLRQWKDRYGAWEPGDWPSLEESRREWDDLISPALPRVEKKLRDNLLLRQIWDNVLDNAARRMLYRMTVLRMPAEWELLLLLGEEGESEAAAEVTAKHLRDTSLLEQLELRVTVGKDKVGRVTEYVLHPTTKRFIGEVHGNEPELLKAAHLRLGTYLEARVPESPYVETNIEAGIHLFEADELNRASDLLGAASEWLQSHGRVREGLDLLKSFLPTEVLNRLDKAPAARLLGTVGLAHLRLGQAEKAIGYYEQRMIIARMIGDRQGEANALGNLGLAYARLGQVEKAIGYHERALAISREIGNRSGEGGDLGNLGIAYASLGQVEKAIGYHEQALAISREIGNRRGEGNSLGNLGVAYARLGQLEKAIEYYEQQLIAVRETGNRQGETNALGNLGLAYMDLGRVEKAIEYHEQALIISREIGDQHGEGSDLGNLGLAYARIGQVEKAIWYQKQTLVMAREIGDRQGEASALGNLGIAYAKLGKLNKAVGHYEQQLTIVREIGDRQGEANALGGLGLVYVGLDQVEKATEHLEHALKIGTDIKDPHIVRAATTALERLRRST